MRQFEIFCETFSHRLMEMERRTAKGGVEGTAKRPLSPLSPLCPLIVFAVVLT